MKLTRRKIIPWCISIAVAAMLAVSLPFLLQGLLPKVYDESFYAVLQDKADLLKRTDGRKTVIIGGSGVAFSVDTDKLSELTGEQAVNFGVYAAFGTTFMTELAEKQIHKGDTVILCPELSSQTCSLYFGGEAALQATEGRPDLLLSARPADWANIITAFPAYLREKTGFLKRGEKPAPSGVYARSSFNENGVLIYDCDANLMDGGYQKGSEPTISPTVYSADFIDYLNRYAAKLRNKGASVYYAFPFMNALSVAGTEEKQAELVRFLNEKLTFPLLSGFEGRILDAGYFYDSNYHLNNAGREAATILLAQDILRTRGNVSLEAALPPPLKWNASDGEQLTTKDGRFLYRLTDSGATLLSVLCECKGEFTAPDTLDGYPLTGVSEGAFSGAEAVSIILPASVTKLGGHLFEGCEKLRELHLLRTESLPSVGDDLLEGFRRDLKIYVSGALYGDYVTDYFWLLQRASGERIKKGRPGSGKT